MEEQKRPWFDIALFGALLVLLIAHHTSLIPKAYDTMALLIASLSGLVPVVWSAVNALKNKKISVDLLASVALIASILAKEWSSAAFINLMLTSARLFDFYTTTRARNAIRSILKFRPKTAHVMREGELRDIPIEEVRIHDRILVKSGERIAVDGEVVEGDGEVDQSSLTGESVPVPKIIGDKVWSGTLLASGTLTMRTEKIGKDTTLERVIALIEGAQKGKAPIKTLADRFATWYIVLVFLSSIAIYVIFRDLPLLLSLLLVACADDIAIAIPMGFLAGIGNAARRGVIVKGGSFLEGLTHVKTIIVDKTGTLTLGALAVQEIRPFGAYSKEDVLQCAGLTTVYSQHPVSRAIVEYIKTQNVHPVKPDRVEELPGKGIEAYFKGRHILFGNPHFIAATLPVIPGDATRAVHNAETRGLNINLFAIDNAVVGYVTSADEMRPEITRAVARLRALGVRALVMLTGDNENVAARIAERAGLTEYHAGLLPEQKLAFLRSRLGGKDKVVMVGDGVNDAAALALADIGVAMGAIGSDAAIEAADVALMKDDFSKIPEMIELGTRTMRIVKQNFVIWGSVNVVGLILVSFGILGPEGASAYNFLTDFLPIMNSMRLFRA